MNIPIKIKLVGSQSMMRYATFLTDSERQSILRKVGAKFKYLAVQNFGYSGTDRPSPWKPLSKDYAKRVKRSTATLDLSGELLRSIRVSPPTNTSIEVYTNNTYAEAHQNGRPAGNLPKRPFFPIDSAGNATARAQRILETTAALELQRLMRQHVK